MTLQGAKKKLNIAIAIWKNIQIDSVLKKKSHFWGTKNIFVNSTLPRGKGFKKGGLEKEEGTEDIFPTPRENNKTRVAVIFSWTD